jgi:uncharacterized CHY-type Zn-finger protein
MPKIYGPIVDEQTRCTHYHTEKDIISIKFKCCHKYYPCFKCHEESENHDIIRWKAQEFDTKTIICGVCKTELTIHEYLKTTHCPNCQSSFNEGCQYHHHLYFEVK